MKYSLLVPCMVLASGLVLADPNPDRSSGSLPEFAKLDANGDGIVTLAEFIAKLPPEFALDAPGCDTDDDKILSMDEYAVCNGGASDTAEQKPSR